MYDRDKITLYVGASHHPPRRLTSEPGGDVFCEAPTTGVPRTIGVRSDTAPTNPENRRFSSLQVIMYEMLLLEK